MVKNNEISHSDLCHLVAKKFLKDVALIEYKCTLVNEEPDVLVFDSYSRTTLYEIKTSRDDYWKDWVKPHRIYYKTFYNNNKMVVETLKHSLGANRYYVCPSNLIQIEELPLGWGLIWYKNNRFYLKRKSELFKHDKGLEARLLINALKRVNENRFDSILIKDYLGVVSDDDK